MTIASFQSINHKIYELTFDRGNVTKNDVLEYFNNKKTLEEDCFKMLLDLRNIISIEAEARHLQVKTNKSKCSAKAILVKNFNQELLIKSYLLTRQTDYPISIFSDRIEAIEWLENSSQTAVGNGYVSLF